MKVASGTMSKRTIDWASRTRIAFPRAHSAPGVPSKSRCATIGEDGRSQFPIAALNSAADHRSAALTSPSHLLSLQRAVSPRWFPSNLLNISIHLFPRTYNFASPSGAFPRMRRTFDSTRAWRIVQPMNFIEAIRCLRRKVSASRCKLAFICRPRCMWQRQRTALVWRLLLIERRYALVRAHAACRHTGARTSSPCVCSEFTV